MAAETMADMLVYEINGLSRPESLSRQSNCKKVQKIFAPTRDGLVHGIYKITLFLLFLADLFFLSLYPLFRNPLFIPNHIFKFKSILLDLDNVIINDHDNNKYTICI
jgi:hypothetical protein